MFSSNRIILAFIFISWSISACSSSSIGFNELFNDLGFIEVELGKTSIEDISHKFSGINGEKLCVGVTISDTEVVSVNFYSDPEMFSSKNAHYINQIEIVREPEAANSQNQCKVVKDAKLKSSLVKLLSGSLEQAIEFYKLERDGDTYVRTIYSKVPMLKDDPHYQRWVGRGKDCFIDPPHEPFIDQYKTLRVYGKDGQITRVIILLMESVC